MAARKQQPARRMPKIFRILHARPKLVASVLLGIITAVLLSYWEPSALQLPRSQWVIYWLIGWDAGVALYIAIVWWIIRRLESRAQVDHIRERAAKEDEGRGGILILTVTATLASVAAIVVLLGQGDSKDAPSQLMFASATILLSWAFVHLIFATHYAHGFYSEGPAASGLKFPGGEKPDYLDFVYFAFVIGMTFQVSDVAVTSRSIRQTVLAHAIVSFLFNVALLAIMINIAANAIGKQS
jgi:uncharacterized membrane protein